MENLKDEYLMADAVYEEYEALLWDMIKKNNPDESLVKIANALNAGDSWIDPKVNP